MYVVVPVAANRWVGLARLLLHPPGATAPGAFDARPARYAFLTVTRVTMPAASWPAALALAEYVGHELIRGPPNARLDVGTAKFALWDKEKMLGALGVAGFASPGDWVAARWGVRLPDAAGERLLAAWAETGAYPATAAV